MRLDFTPEEAVKYLEPKRVKAKEDARKRMLSVDVKHVPMEAMLRAEHDENEIRKNFTVSERVAIQEALDAEAGERRGGDRGNQHTGGKPQKFADSQPKEHRETAHKAAKNAQLGSRETYRKAKKIVEEGDEKLINEMDETGKVDRVYQKLPSQTKTRRRLHAEEEGRDQSLAQCANQSRTRSGIICQ